MNPVAALGAWIYVFAAMSLAVVWITVWAISLRRGPWRPVESKLIMSLFVIAALFPVAGATGTVVGLTSAFKSLGQVPADQKQRLLSEGISQAMHSTAFGMALAVPASIIAVALLLTGAKRAPKKQPPPASG